VPLVQARAGHNTLEVLERDCWLRRRRLAAAACCLLKHAAEEVLGEVDPKVHGERAQPRQRERPPPPFGVFFFGTGSDQLAEDRLAGGVCVCIGKGAWAGIPQVNPRRGDEGNEGRLGERLTRLVG
jgi:hypothetical protein